MRISRRPAAHGRLRLPIVLFALILGALGVPEQARAQPGGHDHAGHGARQPARAKSHHPAPRPGITGASVLRAERVPERARDAYAVAARIPSILDGLFCHCDCHENHGLRSLLECFESDMASTCGICQGQARQAARLHDAGKPLAQIRTAIDDRWGS